MMSVSIELEYNTTGLEYDADTNIVVQRFLYASRTQCKYYAVDKDKGFGSGQSVRSHRYTVCIGSCTAVIRLNISRNKKCICTSIHTIFTCKRNISCFTIHIYPFIIYITYTGANMGSRSTWSDFNFDETSTVGYIWLASINQNDLINYIYISEMVVFILQE